MGRFTVIPQNTFESLQLDAGVLLKRFNPAAPAAPADEDIICATTGGIEITCAPEFSDFGEDIDNCPTNMMELKHLDSWECTMSFTALSNSKEGIRLALGAADIDAETGAIRPRRDLKQTDFTDIWWVGDRTDGGMVAVKLKNALSTSGFSLQTTKAGKGEISVELTGHVSINAQNDMPMEFYSESESASWRVDQILSHVTSSFTDNVIVADEELSATLTADDGYTLETVVVLMGGEDITDDVLVSDTITITAVTGDVKIIATAVAD